MHGAIGVYGLLMPALFAKESHLLQSLGRDFESLPSPSAAKGLFYGGDGRILGAAVVGMVSCSIMSSGAGISACERESILASV